jgi:site-specific DNA-methyltransferase (cytosine-N4-specific)
VLVNGNALRLPLPDKSVHMCVTSPPYWGLRDYGTAEWQGGDAGCDHLAGPLASDKSRLHGGKGVGPEEKLKITGMPYRDTCGKCGAVRVDNQLGLEATPEEFIANMVAVFREVWRVLRDDGQLWLNLGDSYNSSSQHNHGKGGAMQHRHLAPVEGWAGHRPLVDDLKIKDLCGIPWRVALALQADGWYLRSDIIWAKPNPMPESVTDRPTKSHEYLFLLTKRARYYYDADAVREELTDWSKKALEGNWNRKKVIKHAPGSGAGH